MTNLPQIGVIVLPKGNETDAHGRPKLMICLDIMTDFTHTQVYLCDAGQNYQDIAKQLHDRINEAGREARRAASGLIAASGPLGGTNGTRPGPSQ